MIFDYLTRADRRILFLVVAISLSIPLVMNISLRPAPMATADAFYAAVDRLKAEPGKIVLVSADWGPGSSAENRPQTELAIEHLMRKRLPFAIVSNYSLASPFLIEVPRLVAQRLEKEDPGQKWVYGKDWVNLGYRPGGALFIQGLAQAKDISSFLKTDADNTPLAELPAMAGVKNLQDISMLMEFTGLQGIFNVWVQFFKGPPFVYGCTSITIPESFIYFASGQVKGVFEGIAGAAWYEELLKNHYPNRPPHNVALRVNTGSSFAHLVVMGFILLGNIGFLLKKRS